MKQKFRKLREDPRSPSRLQPFVISQGWFTFSPGFVSQDILFAAFSDPFSQALSLHLFRPIFFSVSTSFLIFLLAPYFPVIFPGPSLIFYGPVIFFTAVPFSTLELRSTSTHFLGLTHHSFSPGCVSFLFSAARSHFFLRSLHRRSLSFAPLAFTSLLHFSAFQALPFLVSSLIHHSRRSHSAVAPFPSLRLSRRCSTRFAPLGSAQASSLSLPHLPGRFLYFSAARLLLGR